VGLLNAKTCEIMCECNSVSADPLVPPYKARSCVQMVLYGVMEHVYSYSVAHSKMVLDSPFFYNFDFQNFTELYRLCHPGIISNLSFIPTSRILVSWATFHIYSTRVA